MKNKRTPLLRGVLLKFENSLMAILFIEEISV